MAWKREKLEELITHLAAQCVQEESTNASLITVTKTIAADNLKTVTVFVTVYPESEEARALEFLKRKRSDVREFITKHARMRVAPHVDFAIDIGEKTRQKIDELGSLH